jgi:glycosyltransferase involved in cell wall biosynthesis
MSIPLVSIIIAAYRSCPDFILLSIDSALAQSWPSIEVLVRDDSPDDSLREIIVSRKDPRVNYHHNLISLGTGNNHWQAFMRAQGEFIVILNHDDLLAADFVSSLVPMLQHNPGLVLAFCDHWIIDNSGLVQDAETDSASQRYGRKNLKKGVYQPFGSLLVDQTIPMAMGTVFRRTALPLAFPSQAGPAYDIWLTYLLAKTGGGAYYLPEKHSYWRSHADNQTSAGGIDWLYGSASCWHTVANDHQFRLQRPTAQRKAASAFTACALRSWRIGHPVSCMRFAFCSLQHRLSVRGLALLFLMPFLPFAFFNFVGNNLRSLQKNRNHA